MASLEEDFGECQNCGMESLIAKVQKKNRLPSTKSIKQEHFTSVIKNVQQLQDNFFWQANTGDLWKLLAKYLSHPDISPLFENEDEGSMKIIERICTTFRLILHKKLASWYMKKYPEEIKTCQKFEQIISIKLSQMCLLDFSQSLIFRTVFKEVLDSNQLRDEQFLHFLNNFEQIFSEEAYRKCEKNFLDFILRRVRNSSRKKTTLGYSIRLIILYLKIIIDNKSYYRLFMSNFNLSKAFLNLLVKPKGILNILRILEDSLSVETIKKEYEFTRDLMHKKGDQEKK